MTTTDYLIREFNLNYEYLYEHDSEDIELIALFDDLMNARDNTFADDFQKLTRAFVNLRGDFISSDREANAFMVTIIETLETTPEEIRAMLET